ncbi:MAG: hypothetical protein M3Q29_02280 [Chloroflexota bacterium]|nr:hypothetical protein [Chloroflexota bacterium]
MADLLTLLSGHLRLVGGLFDYLTASLGAGTKRGLGSYFGDAGAGLSYALKDRFVSRLLGVQALASFATGATSAMLVVLASRG